MQKHNVAINDESYALLVRRKAELRAAGKQATYSTVILEVMRDT